VSGVLVVALGLGWMLAAAQDLRIYPDRRFAASTDLGLLRRKWTAAQASLADQHAMAAQARVDAFRGVPAGQLLTGLRGKNVILVFVESYGRSALEDPRMAPPIDALLDKGTTQLAAAGFNARSGWLTSPTYGGGSWLAHSTLLSGLWAQSQGRYEALMSTDRLTLNRAFREGGWRTIGVEPAIKKGWPEGKFYGYDKVYDRDNLGYRGPSFGYAPMTDQYVMSTIQSQEIAGARKPVMAEVVLVSSHTPWAPLPRQIGWGDVGDGSVFTPMPAQGQAKDQVWQSQSKIRAAYVQSVQYSLNVLIDYVKTYADPNTVLVFLGDHQPSSVVTSSQFGSDVPITIVSHDPAVLNRVGGWGWTPGLRPTPQAPVWLMSAFRDRFLTAFGSPQTASPQTAPPQTAPPAAAASSAGRATAAGPPLVSAATNSAGSVRAR
jgi:hypothetical protein